MKTKKGFTLVELLVVIAILAILATATIVGFTAFTQKAKQSNIEGELKQVVELIQIEDYYNGNFEIQADKIAFDNYDDDGDPETDKVAYTFAQIFVDTKDGELAKYGSRTTYNNGAIRLVSSDGDFYAEWAIQTNTFTSGKVGE